MKFLLGRSWLGKYLGADAGGEMSGWQTSDGEIPGSQMPGGIMSGGWRSCWEILGVGGLVEKCLVRECWLVEISGGWTSCGKMFVWQRSGVEMSGGEVSYGCKVGKCQVAGGLSGKCLLTGSRFGKCLAG